MADSKPNKKHRGRKRRRFRAVDLARQTKERLEFATVLRFYSRKCQTKEGRRRLEAMDLMSPVSQKAHFQELEGWQRFLGDHDPMRLPTIPADEVFQVNPTLDPFGKQLLRDLGALMRFWRSLSGREELAFAVGEWLEDEALAALADRLDGLFDETGDWHERISPTYHRLIQTWLQEDAQLTQALEAIIRRSGAFLNEDIVFERNHRRVLAVKIDFRGRVKGIQHDYSSSGNTVYLEPEETVARQNKLMQLEAQLREELFRIRVEVTSAILDQPRIRREICPLLTGFDSMQALCQVAREGRCQIVTPNQERRLELWDARHPFLDEHFAQARAEVFELETTDDNNMVPFQLHLDDQLLGLVISGANTGGKTVTLKTTGLMAWMANSGLPIPVDEGSQVPFYQHILADIGDNQSLSHNLSTFAGHLANLGAVLDLEVPDALVLLDELGSGTDPGEGNALAQAVLDEMSQRGLQFLVTTHQQILCTMAMTHERMDNGSMIFDAQQLRPTYRFSQGVPGRSHALDIAKNAGLPEPILAAAQQLVDDHQVDIQAAIRTLQEQSRQAQKQKQRLRKEELRLHRRIKEAREEKERYARMEETLKQKSRERLQKLVDRAEKELRSTLQEASSKQVRNASAKFAATRNQILEPFATPKKLEPEPKPPSEVEPSQWQVGDKVYLKTWRKEGRLLNLDRKKARIDVGGMTLNVGVADLVHLKDQTPQQGRVMEHLDDGGDVALAVEMKLLGYRVEDALLELDRAVDLALRKGTPFLKIIHGHGSGTLKAAVRDFLRKHTAKSSFEVVLDPENDGTTELKFT